MIDGTQDKVLLRRLMSRRAPDPNDPVGPESRQAFADHLLAGCKPREAWAVGSELEMIGYERDSLERIDPATVQAVVADFEPFGAQLVVEGTTVMEARAEWGSITVEPGGQVEFSGDRYIRLADLELELRLYISRLGEIAERRGLLFAAVGFDPLRSAAEQHWFPKRRYEIMRPYLATRGRRGWDMMCRTTAIQANVDYGSPSGLARKFIVGNRLGPIVCAMFANSPFENGRLSGYKSTRAAVWLETDPDRSGVAPASLDDDFTIDAFVDRLLAVPMLFVRRGGSYLNLAGLRFDEFLEGAVGDITPRFQDFTDHLTTMFTDARVKQHLESRTADSGDVASVLALQAFWKGILYDSGALGEALALAPRLDAAGFAALGEEVARRGLEAEDCGVRVLEVAREAVRLAVAGLRSIAPDEVHYLDPLVDRVVERGICPADLLIREFEGAWGGDASKALTTLRI